MKNDRIMKKVPIFAPSTVTSASQIANKEIFFLFASITFSAGRWLQMIKQSAKAADDLGTQSIFKKYTISALSNFLLCLSQATKLAQNYGLSHGFCWKDDSSDKSGDDVKHCHVGVEGLSDLKDGRWRRGEEKKRHSLFKKRNIPWKKTMII